MFKCQELFYFRKSIKKPFTFPLATVSLKHSALSSFHVTSIDGAPDAPPFLPDTW